MGAVVLSEAGLIMKRRYSLFLATVGLAIGAIALGPTRPTQAFGLSFTPTGNPVSGGIPHLNVAPGDPVVFDLLFDSNGLSSADVVNEISVYMAFDSAELFDPSYPGAMEIPPTHSGSGIRYQGLKYSGLTIKGDKGSSSIGKISFKTNPSGLPANDELDFSLVLTGVSGSQSFFTANPHSSLASLGVIQNSQVYQEVEVQSAARAVPTPALLPGMVAFGLGLVRKRKQEWVG
jgi:hypothetical protein